jgi:hypothetical protein
VRVLASTALAPMPPFVAAAGTPIDAVLRLRAAFIDAAREPWFSPLADQLLLEGFEQAGEGAFATLLEWDRAARAAGYEFPA